MRYLNDEEKTKEVIEVIDSDRWLHSGDIGTIDKVGVIVVRH